MEKRYQVFISSTFADLQEERKAVINGILQHNCFPSGMELFPASDLSQFDYIKSVIDESDYYILISAGRYGTIFSEEGISFTEMEYNYALEKGVPILIFLVKNVDDLTGKLIEPTDEIKKKLNEFRIKLSANRLCNYYTNCDNLQNHVSKSLYKAIKMTPRTGWIRGDIDNSFLLLEQLNSIRIENEDLKTKLTNYTLSCSQEKNSYEDIIGLDDEFELTYDINYDSFDSYSGFLTASKRTTLTELFESFGDQLLDGFTINNLRESLARFVKQDAYNNVSKKRDALTNDGIEYLYEVILPDRMVTQLLVSLELSSVVTKEEILNLWVSFLMLRMVRGHKVSVISDNNISNKP